ncbi:gamma carbonic anhydrase family protein [Nocardioides acrostichi]|uniref:Gamma carbonic anhydrase family protein n=1 Tax=Nocardioides acrostichi TaxID=2784339 RepID=A0A930UXK7_9ACTN|nr:gamma carbonic anhydrase family protein [Nocardioides acrostichi]MBF4162733.1 gamma carbonic anhydrase family protein [Nocardioides acrostichi]
MPLYSLEGASPDIHPTAFIAPTATLVGQVIVEAGASIWYNAVIRADYAPIVIRAGANVQDGSVMHGPPDLPTEVGPGATVGHLCVVHGAVIGARALVGNGSTVLDGARIGSRCLVAAHSMVAAGAEFAANTLIAGAPAVAKRDITGSVAEQWVDGNPDAYAALAARHRDGILPVT